MLAGTLISIIAVAGHALATTPAAPPPAAASAPRASAAPAPYATADDLLTALETADQHLVTLTSDIQIKRDLAIEGDTQIRIGKLYYKSGDTAKDGPEGRNFAVSIAETVYGSRHERTDQQFIFDGRWFVEKLPAERQFNKREVVAPGETFDPIRIVDSPFPVPIGQRREAVLARYEASLPPPTETLVGLDPGLVQFVEGQRLQQLRLVPRQGAEEAEQFIDVRVWYRWVTAADNHPILLPQLARTETLAGDVTLVLLPRLTANAPLPDGVFDTTAPEGWAVQIEPWRAPVREPAPTSEPTR